MKRSIVFGIVVVAVALTAAFPFIWRAWVTAHYRERIVTAMAAPPTRVAIVFGARVYTSGRLSAMLSDRMDRAIELYKAGKVQKLLVSGDNRFVDYDEPGRMMEYAISRGVPPEDVQPDYGGRRTYDTCYRAKAIFQVDAAILVTQEFHLPRALFTCSWLGIDAIGVAADRRIYSPSSLAWSETREMPALLVALVDVLRRAPPPVMGPPIPLRDDNPHSTDEE